MQKRFQRTIEDFHCEHCGAHVVGSGYTNHCPECLWSKHVDIQPGDRAAECHGMMEPIAVIAGEPNRLVHRCKICGLEKRNKVQEGDSFEQLLTVSRLASERVLKSS